MFEPKNKQVVAYCRVSTMEQKKNGYGIDIQIRDATLYARNNGLLIEKFYRDEGESGVKEDRRALRELLRDCQAGRIRIVILPSLDRLSREVRIAENLFHEFERLKIKVLIADMPQYNGERKDVLIRQIMEAIAEENRKDIIDRLLKGRQERVRKGFFPGGNLPYGYMRKGKTVQIQPHEAKIIDRIFILNSKHYTGQAIANALNLNGNKRRNGKPWTQRQICRILARKGLYKAGALHYGSIYGKTMMIVPIH